MIGYSLAISLTLLSVCIALKFGGAPERRGAMVIVVAFFLGILRDLTLGPQLAGFSLAGITIDFIMFVGFFAIALFAWRVWPLWASALQLLAIVAHLVQVLEIHLQPTVYLLMRFAPTILVEALLVVICLHIRMMGSLRDKDQCWRSWSGSSIPSVRSR
jgi:hypothetical protein